ncbi:hypothetical protein BH23VER1_BH23VER1_28420 [soil metagenome]
MRILLHVPRDSTDDRHRGKGYYANLNYPAPKTLPTPYPLDTLLSSSTPRRRPQDGGFPAPAACALAILVPIVLATPLQAQFDVLNEISSAVEFSNASPAYDPEKEVVSWVGAGGEPLSLKFEEVQIFADSVEYDIRREIVHAKGDVAVYKDGFVYRGENIRYDVRSDELAADGLRSSFEDIYFDAGSFETNTDTISVLNTENTYFTTHDSINPNWHIRAKTVDIYPEDRVVFRDLTAYAGSIPVFYFPYLSQPFDEDLGYTFSPGYSSNWGAYLLNQYGTLVGDHSIAKFQLDLRSSRGLAGGIELDSRRHRDKPDFGQFKFYYAHDSSPGELSSGDGLRTGDAVPDTSRYRINLQHRIYLPGPEESTFYIDFDINKLSDVFFYEDFFPGEFRTNPQPDNIVNAVKTHDRGTLSLLTRFQANDFFQTDTRLPELALDFTRQPIFNTGLFYEGTTSAGIYREELSSIHRRGLRDEQLLLREQQRDLRDLAARIDGDPDFRLQDGSRPDSSQLRQQIGLIDDQIAAIGDQADGPGFTRLHTYHEALYPKTLGGWLNLIPRFGVGATAYSDVDAPGENPGDHTRGIVHAGLDASFKLSKVYENAQSDVLGIDGIRHVVQPYANYSFLSAGDDDDSRVPRIDRLVRSTRLRPLDVPQFTAIDDLSDWNILRLGTRQRLFTRRDDANYDWMGFNTFLDVYGEDPEFDRSHSNLFNQFTWRPLPWLRYELDTQIPIGGGDDEFTEIDNSLYFQPTKWWEFSLGHRFLQDHPFFEDSSLITFNTYARINEQWGFGMIQRFELDDSVLESQQYTLHRDLTSWVASLGASIRDNRSDQLEYGIVFTLTLKEFPQLGIPLELDPQRSSGE